MFSAAIGYEKLMGRWSRLLASLFVEFVNVRDGDSVLDVGCGTGSLASEIARATRATKIIGIDPSAGFIEHARSHHADPRISFEIGDAQRLPYPNASFDRALALLVINFIPDARKAVSEMRRVTKPGGIVATAMWDNTGANELTGTFWNAAVAVDPGVKRPDQRPQAYGSPEALLSLWNAVGFANTEIKELSMQCDFSSFDDYWLPHREGEGPGGAYLKTLPEVRQEAVRERLHRDIFGSRPDGPFTLKSNAWAIRGAVP